MIYSELLVAKTKIASVLINAQCIYPIFSYLSAKYGSRHSLLKGLAIWLYGHPAKGQGCGKICVCRPCDIKVAVENRLAADT